MIIPYISGILPPLPAADTFSIPPTPATPTLLVAPATSISCSLCKGSGHTDRDCKEVLLQQLEKQRLERDAERNGMINGGGGGGMECVDITQDDGEHEDDGEQEEQSSRCSVDKNDDFISMLDGLGKV